MIALLDVDGVCADFVGHLIARVRPVLPGTGRPMTPDDVTVWQLLDLLTQVDRAAALRELASAEFWRSMPLVDGAADGVADLRADGYDVVFVTSPWHDCREWSHVRRTWLVDHLGARERDVVICERKDLIAGDLLVDDKESHVLAWRAAHPAGRGYLFDMPHNRGADAALPRWRW